MAQDRGKQKLLVSGSSGSDAKAACIRLPLAISAPSQRRERFEMVKRIPATEVKFER